MDYENNDFKVEANGKMFCYNFNNITSIQAELAQSVGEWKYDQMQAGQNPTFEDLEKSGGADWLFLMTSLLFTEEKDGISQPYSRPKAKEIESIFKATDNQQRKVMREAAKDFFLKTENGELSSKLLSLRQKQDGLMALLPFLIGTTGNQNKTD